MVKRSGDVVLLHLEKVDNVHICSLSLATNGYHNLVKYWGSPSMVLGQVEESP